jgi:hypothetical protein
VVGAIAPRAESSTPAPRRSRRGIIGRKWVSTIHDPLSIALARSRRDGDVVGVADVDRSAAGHVLPEGSGVAPCATRVRTICAVG